MFFRKRQLVQNADRVSAKRPGWFLFFRESFSGFLLAALVVSCLGFGAVLWGWSQRDQVLTDILHQQLQEKYPEWNISFESAEIDHRGRVIITGLQMNPEAAQMPLCSIEGVRITVDQDLLFNQRQLDVQLIEVNRPKLNLHRASSGKWNWEDLPLLDQQQGAPPIIKIRDAEVILQWEHEQFARAVRVQLKAVDADIVPTGMHRFTFQGTGHEETLGVSQFSGKIDTLHRNWSLAGKLKGLVIDQPFLQAATLLSADANRVVSELKNSRIGNSHNLTGYSNAISGPASEQDSFSLQLTANLEFEISQQAGALPEYTLFADLVNGQLMHPGLPIPLDQIQGRIAVDRLGVRLEQIVLASGKTSAHISGAWGWQAGNLPEHVTEGFDVVLKDYLVTQETRDYLPLGSRRVFDDLSPAGILNTSFFIKRGVDRPFDFDLKTAEISNASMRYRLFAYPVQQIQGIVRRVDNGLGPETWSMNFSGVVSGQPATFTGTLIDPGPDYETEMSVAVNRLPIDKQFYRALRPQDRAILAELELQGMADAQCTIVRKLAVREKPIFRIKADIYDASMRVRSFPLAIDQCSGHVEFDENGWLFTRLEGKHGETQLNGMASVLPQNGDWKLEITASAKQARFDQNLRLACEVASEEITEAWSSLRPRGEFDVTVKVDCLLGSRNEISIEIPDMHLRKCEINPRAFPWRLSELDATVSVLNGVVIFNELNAVHGLSEIRTTGSFASNSNGWQLHFEKLEVDDLFPDHEFMAALPNEFRQLMESMKIDAPASVSGRLNLAGDYRDQSVEADWDAKIVLSQADMFLGVDCKDISGVIEFSGKMDRQGTVTLTDGELALASCWVMGYHVTDIKGPFVIKKDLIEVGSSKMFPSRDQEEGWKTVSSKERVSGKIFGGELFLDLIAARSQAMPYSLRCTLSRADLEQWAIQSNYGQADVRGEMNGYINLAGDTVSARNTVGDGELQISPAALYELPNMFKLFQKLSLTPADGTAFRNARAKFHVRDEKFIFDEIGLFGESMSLLGEGYVRFDRTIDLDLVYRPPRRSRINLVSKVLRRLESVLPALFTVDITGTIGDPHVEVNGGANDALQRFVKVLEAGTANLLPPMIIPPPQRPLSQRPLP